MNDDARDEPFLTVRRISDEDIERAVAFFSTPAGRALAEWGNQLAERDNRHIAEKHGGYSGVGCPGCERREESAE